MLTRSATRLAAALWAIGPCAAICAPAWAEVPVMPTLSQPEGAAKPYGSTDPDVANLAKFGYVQDEVFISGKIAGGLPYTTRLLVRRPVDPKKFSGVVVAESIRSSGVRILWTEARYLMARGHAFVEIGSNLSVNTLVKPSNPTRYAGLNVPNPTPGKLVFGHVQDIAAQAGLLLKSNLPHGPFKDMPVRHLVLGGCSEQGMFVRLYMRDSHAKFRMPNGKSIYDGYFPACVADWPPILGHEDGTPLANFTQPAVEVPTIMLATSEPEGFPQDGRRYRRPDSDAPGDKFRLYEVAAMPHGLDFRAFAALFPKTLQCNGKAEQRSDFIGAYPANNALDKLIRWVTKGTPPPRGARLEVASASGPLVKDQFGNPKGGVRTTQLDVPVAAYHLCDTGKVSVINPVGIDFGAAYMVPFTPERLKALYPTPKAYVDKVGARLNQLVKQGWYLPEDAAEVRAAAVEFAKKL